jgi:hypothetical protein
VGDEAGHGHAVGEQVEPVGGLDAVARESAWRKAASTAISGQAMRVVASGRMLRPVPPQLRYSPLIRLQPVVR